ncbi:MAG TPA: molybdate ABC transporter substrate-binding protein [Vicinamibacteria bacterium]|nr:molybdate ABC transporter substrate-binding protein [Vicinamibacteria bacterium]
MRRLSFAARLAALVAAVAAPVASAETIRVFAAASLMEAFRDMAALYELQHAGDAIELNFAGSQVLRTQIEQGASADVFASADLVHAEVLKAAGLLGPYMVFARNRLVVVVPAASPRVKGLQDVARPGVKVLVAGPTVPVGRYTTQALARLGAAGLYGDDFQTRVRANVVSQETNVRAVLAKVGLGEADAGFVYITDAATAAQKVQVIDIPERHNVIAEYPIGVVTKSAAATQAKAFSDLVLGPEGQAILRKYGFAR